MPNPKVNRLLSQKTSIKLIDFSSPLLATVVTLHDQSCIYLAAEKQRYIAHLYLGIYIYIL